MKRTVDVVIVGGGMVGAALAAALAQSELAVAIIEPRPPAAPPGETIGLRVSAISPASQRLLSRLGAWPRIAAGRITPYTGMAVWDATGNGAIHFSAAELGEPLLGHIIENDLIQYALWERLGELPAVQRHAGASLRGIELGPLGMRAMLDDGSHLDCQLVVGADGGQSQVRRFAGIRTFGWSYGQKTIVGNLRTRDHHAAIARQRFLPGGPVALLPLPDGRSSLAWHASAAQVDWLLQLDDDGFRGELEVALGGVLGPIEELGPRGAFPLRLQHAATYARPGIVLVGDAAHTIHPLAGQGVNLGFLDAAVLAETLAEGYAKHRRLGELALLRGYESRRRTDNLAVQFAMDGFHRLFSNNLAPLRLARNLGLQLAEKASLPKKILMRKAMGNAGNTPTLML